MCSQSTKATCQASMCVKRSTTSVPARLVAIGNEHSPDKGGVGCFMSIRVLSSLCANSLGSSCQIKSAMSLRMTSRTCCATAVAAPVRPWSTKLTASACMKASSGSTEAVTNLSVVSLACTGFISQYKGVVNFLRGNELPKNPLLTAHRKMHVLSGMLRIPSSLGIAQP